MRQCWSECPLDRPFFSELLQKLEFTESDAHIYVNFDDIAPNYIFPPTATEDTAKTNFKESSWTIEEVIFCAKTLNEFGILWYLSGRNLLQMTILGITDIDAVPNIDY